MPTSSPRIGKLPMVRRLPAYLRLLRQLQHQGWEAVSGTYLAEQLKLDPIQVRKDLSATGIVGKPRVGFSVDGLIAAIEDYLGWNNTTEAILIGAGSLGTALLGYSGFEKHGLSIVAAFDTAAEKIGTEVHGKPVFHLEKLPDIVQRLHVRIGVVSVPAEFAQDAANRLVAVGIIAIWNFTPVTLMVPANVIVQNEDLSSGLAVLSRRLHDAESAHPGIRESRTEAVSQ